MRISRKVISPLSVFLKERRLRAGLSQGDVSKKLGYTTPQFVSNWERGHSDPPISTLKKLAVLYKIPTDELYQVALDASILRVTEEFRQRFLGLKR